MKDSVARERAIELLNDRWPLNHKSLDWRHSTEGTLVVDVVADLLADNEELSEQIGSVESAIGMSLGSLMKPEDADE